MNIEHVSSEMGNCLTIRLGVGIIRDTQNRKSETLVKAADKALYEAKEKGRSQSVAVLI